MKLITTKQVETKCAYIIYSWQLEGTIGLLLQLYNLQRRKLEHAVIKPRNNGLNTGMTTAQHGYGHSHSTIPENLNGKLELRK